MKAQNKLLRSFMSLPTDPQERKNVPIASGVLDYFPDAIAAVAGLSRAGNEQHNPGKPLHWDRDKSGDEADALMRHFMERGTLDTDGIRHSAKVAWRALALLQKELEAAYGLPLPRGARQSMTATEIIRRAPQSIRDTFIEETSRTEIPEEDYGNSLATEPGRAYIPGPDGECLCAVCANSRQANQVPQASFPPYTFTYPSLARVAGVERSEVVGIPAERAESEGQPLASQVRSVERIKEAVFGTKQTPEV
jgi:hypothetical protein